tara:strand:- start:72056 stop:72523 length:468 start_codon:yes stop_codon:yes gene_type:complete
MNQDNIIIASIVGALLLVTVAAFIFSGSKEGPEAVAGDYDTFAQCLYDSGLRMYGSATCHFCAQQRSMFGGSFKFIREIECDPRNALAETERCIAKNIEATPTWILEDENGNDIERFEAGVQQLTVLSEKSGCPLVKDSEEQGTSDSESREVQSE